MTKKARNYLAFVSALLILSTLLTPPFLPIQAATLPPLIRLQYATFDPLAGEPDVPAEQRLNVQTGRPATYLLQFTGPVHEDWKAQVEAAGACLYGYVPDYAFIARMDGATAREVAALPFVRWVGPYHPAYRLASALQTSEVSPTSEVWTVTVQTLPDADLDSLAKQVKALGGAVQAQSANDFAGYLRLSLPANHLPDVTALDEVLWVEPYFEPQLYNDVGGGTIMRASEVRTSLGLYGSGQTVAVADTGLDVGTTGTAMSDDFEGRIVEGQAICAYFQGGRTTWNDFGGHGTHVAGSVLGSGQNSGSNPTTHQYGGSFAGVAPESQLVFQSIDNAPGGSLECIPMDLSTYVFGPAHDLGARVHTNSWGGPTGDQENPYGGYDSLSQAADQAAWTYKNLLILYAAGNSGTDANADGVIDPDSLGSPGTAKNVLTVGASENVRLDTTNAWGGDDYPVPPINGDRVADNAAGMAAFSSRGPTDDGRIKPDVAAPGTNIISARSHDPDAGTGWGVYDDDYLYMGGTSMSTPLTAGAAAVVREWLTRIKSVANPSAALMKAVLVNGAADMSPGQYTSPQEIPAARPNNVTGWGRVDLVGSVDPPAPRKVWFKDHTTGLSTGGSVEYALSIGASQMQGRGEGETGRQGDEETHHPATPTPTPTPTSVPALPHHSITPAPFVAATGSGNIHPLGTSQLLQNPGFDTGTWTPWQTMGYPELTDQVYRSASYSAWLAGYNNADDYIYQSVTVPSDATKVVLDFWYRVYSEETAAHHDYLCYDITDASASTLINGSYCDDLYDTTQGQWINVQHTLSGADLTPLLGQTVLVWFYVQTNATNFSSAWVDDTALNVTTGGGPTETPTPTPTPTPTGTPPPCPEALNDGGFEASTGDTSNPHWTVSGNARFTVNQGIARTGEDAAILGYTSGPPDTGDLWQAVSVSADASSAMLSFWYQTMGDGSFTVDVDVTDSSGSTVLVHLTTLTTATYDWQQYSHSFTSGELASIAGQNTRLRFRISGSSIPEDVVIDDVSWQICTGGAPPQTGGPFRFTLAWTDYPGETVAAKALVNDLDLEIIGPDGTHYYGNAGLYTSGQCLRSGQWDACNNVEGIIIPDASYGTYTIIVHGYNVAQGPQPFALVASGDNLREGSGPPPTYDNFVYLPLVLRQ